MNAVLDRIDQLLDPFADGELPLLAVALEVLRTTAQRHHREPLAIFLYERAHPLRIGGKLRGLRVDVGDQLIHWAGE